MRFCFVYFYTFLFPDEPKLNKNRAYGPFQTKLVLEWQGTTSDLFVWWEWSSSSNYIKEWDSEGKAWDKKIPLHKSQEDDV